MLYIGYLMIVNGLNIKKIEKFSIFELWRLENCECSLCAHQVPLNHLNSNFEAFGVPMAQVPWAYRSLRGSPWVLKYPCCHQMTTQTRPRGDKRVSEKAGF